MYLPLVTEKVEKIQYFWFTCFVYVFRHLPVAKFHSRCNGRTADQDMKRERRGVRQGSESMTDQDAERGRLGVRQGSERAADQDTEGGSQMLRAVPGPWLEHQPVSRGAWHS